MINTSHIEKRIAEINASLNANSIPMTVSEAAGKDLANLDFTNIAFDSEGDKLTALAALAKPYQETKERESLQATLDANLMHGNKKYIISNEPHLVSPAGFHPDTNVYITTQIAIHSDTPGTHPSIGAIFVHKMR
jgi:hypothetical protein